MCSQHATHEPPINLVPFHRLGMASVHTSITRKAHHLVLEEGWQRMWQQPWHWPWQSQTVRMQSPLQLQHNIRKCEVRGQVQSQPLCRLKGRPRGQTKGRQGQTKGKQEPIQGRPSADQGPTKGRPRADQGQTKGRLSTHQGQISCFVSC